MSKSEDINTLFRRFGGNADTYQEIVAGEQVAVAEQRWPILGQLRPHGHREAPDARKGSTAIGERQVQGFLTPPREPVAPVAQSSASSIDAQQLGQSVRKQVAVSEPVVSQGQVASSQARSAELPSPRVSPPLAPAMSVASSPSLAARVRGRVLPAPADGAEVASHLRSIVPSAVEPVHAHSVDLDAEPALVTASEVVDPDLQSLFLRLVPPKVEPPVVKLAAPLKRLIKW
jgi:hypothetical protein